nr:hypothetical protein [Tanacetum cinerariifolium]
MALDLMAKAFKFNTIPTNNNQRSSLFPGNSQITQPGMHTSQDMKMKMVDDGVGNLNVENMNRLSVVPEIAYQYGNGNVVTASVEGNGNGINGNPIRCYNYRGEGHYASNYIVTQGNRMLLIFNNSCRLLKRKKQGSKELKRNLNGSAEVPKDKNGHDHDISNMLTQEVLYTDLQTKLDPQLGDLKGKGSDTQCASNTLDPLSRKLEDENVSLEFLILNYAKENAHLKTTYKNLFDSIKVTQAQTNSIINSFLKQGYDTNYENAKLRAQQCLVTANHDVCVLNYVNDMNSRADNQSANVLKRKNQKKHKENVKKLKKLGSKGSLASSRPGKPRTCLRWITIGRIFAMCGKLTTSSNTENKSENSMSDNARVLFGNSKKSHCVINDFSDMLIDFSNGLWIFMAIPKDQPTVVSQGVIRRLRLGILFHDPARNERIYPGTLH